MKSFRFKMLAGPSGIFTVDDSGPECYPPVFLDGKPISGPECYPPLFLDGKPIDENGFFHGVMTFDAGKIDRECMDCGQPIGSRDWQFLFDDGGVCERCAGIEWV